jgi:hypothetical protein
MPSLRHFAGAPGVSTSAFVGELVLEPSHGSAVSILVKFSDILMREDVPMVLGSDRNTRPRGRMARTPFRYSIAEFPTVRGNFFFDPLALFVIPLVPAANPHPSVLSALKDFKLIVCPRRIFF